MIIDVTYDTSVTSNANAAAIEAVVNGVVQLYETQFTDPITINIDVGWGEVDGQRLERQALGESMSYYTNTQYSYTEIKTALTADAKSGDDATALASLPATDPTNGGLFAMTTAEAKALGLTGASGAPDGYVGFDSTAGTFDLAVTTNTSNASVPNSEYELFGVVAHEFSEIMGRQANFNIQYNDGPGDGSGYYPLDLFDYSAAGVRSFSASAPTRYFSFNGGVTNLDNFNTDSSGDLFDWAASAGADAFDAFSYPGQVNLVTGADLRLLDVVGYDPTTNFTWQNQVSDAFGNANDWTAGVSPGAPDAAILDAPGSTRYTVTSSTNETVASIQTASTAFLNITGGVFTAAGGSGGGAVAGNIVVGSGATLDVGGGLVNSAVITLYGSEIMVAAGGASLTGSGYVSLSDSAANEITGATSGATLTVDQILEGAGKLGGGQMTLINQAKGAIYSFGANALIINTGGNTITNAGALEAVGTGGATIVSAVANSGRLIAWTSTLTLEGAVSGGGYGEVHDGTLKIASSAAFNQTVLFDTGATGTLELAHGQTYAGTIYGLSGTGANALDLDDITFINPTQTTATFSGTSTGGILTVTDGTHTAHIRLAGNYVGHTFTTSLGAGGVGTRIVDPAQSAGGHGISASAGVGLATQSFVQAMARMGAPDAATPLQAVAASQAPLMLVAPRALAG